MTDKRGKRQKLTGCLQMFYKAENSGFVLLISIRVVYLADHR